MKEKMKIFKEIIILTIINAVLISIISGIGRIIVLNIMQNLDSTNDMRNTYIMYLADTEENQVRSLNANIDFNISLILIGILFIITLIVNMKVYIKNKENINISFWKVFLCNTIISSTPFILPAIFWIP